MKPTIKFLGVGGAFAPLSKGNSSMLITAASGKRMLIDCGTSLQYTLKDDFGLDPRDIDAVYITHPHADHIGSMEWFAFYRRFLPVVDDKGNTIKPKLFVAKELMHPLWEHSLRGGMECMNKKECNLTDYFDCFSVDNKFAWEGLMFHLVPTTHMASGYSEMKSYGLFIRTGLFAKRTYISGDTRYNSSNFRQFDSDQIFQDCETLPVKSGAHAHYDELKETGKYFKNKMWLYHYAEKIPTVKEDGFLGFVEKGQEFEL